MPAAETQYTEIGAFDAKPRLSESLRKVDQGERFRITVRGRTVADIVPSRGSDRERAAEAVRNLLG
jgi:prevent-host-death family protein